MRLFVSVIVAVIFLIDKKSILGSVVNDEHDFHVCKKNESVSLKISTSKGIDPEKSETCQCSIKKPESSTRRKADYLYTPGIGAYKLHRSAKKWNEARKICMEEGGHLAIINSKAEEAILIKILLKDSGKIKGAMDNVQAYLGVHDMFAEGEWVTVFGESMNNTGYSEWSPNFYGVQPDNYMGSQNCGTVVHTGGMDDVFCTDKFGFFCEIPFTC